uniref:Vomeronasal type-1 receptor n=1 Tax=Ornithorhynchus anatinus TaxID=9258 RepID=F6PN93_ORNAN
RNFLDAVGCKIIFYFHQVARALSLCTTCLLSIFQAVTISPDTYRWAGVKSKLPECIISSYVTTLIYISGPLNSTRNTVLLNYCSSVSDTAGITLVNAIVLSLRDLFFVGIMSVASSYMVFVLHRHHRQVHHLHGSGCSPKEMLKVRASKRVITLVTLCILLYGKDYFVSAYYVQSTVSKTLSLLRRLQLMSCQTLRSGIPPPIISFYELSITQMCGTHSRSNSVTLLSAEPQSIQREELGKIGQKKG